MRLKGSREGRRVSLLRPGKYKGADIGKEGSDDRVSGDA